MGRRNYTSVEYSTLKGDLIFDIRVEKEKGAGESVGFVFSSSHSLRFLI
jgi:hypothetical protein